VHVPFRGTAPLLTAIIAGQVQVIADPSTTSLPHIQSGKLHPIAVNSRQRFAKLPDVPTVFDAGFPYLENTFWLGVVVPAKTPPEIVDKLNSAFRKSLDEPQARERLAALGAEIKVGTPAEFGEFLAKESAKWSRVVKEANITVK
jgi:tripartite-type tricarboxylate transporter receptor subunit TctC